jgi:hypothetical protein
MFPPSSFTPRRFNGGLNPIIIRDDMQDSLKKATFLKRASLTPYAAHDLKIRTDLTNRNIIENKEALAKFKFGSIDSPVQSARSTCSRRSIFFEKER